MSYTHINVYEMETRCKIYYITPNVYWTKFLVNHYCKNLEDILPPEIILIIINQICDKIMIKIDFTEKCVYIMNPYNDSILKTVPFDLDIFVFKGLMCFLYFSSDEPLIYFLIKNHDKYYLKFICNLLPEEFQHNKDEKQSQEKFLDFIDMDTTDCKRFAFTDDNSKYCKLYMPSLLCNMTIYDSNNKIEISKDFTIDYLNNLRNGLSIILLIVEMKWSPDKSKIAMSIYDRAIGAGAIIVMNTSNLDIIYYKEHTSGFQLRNISWNDDSDIFIAYHEMNLIGWIFYINSKKIKECNFYVNHITSDKPNPSMISFLSNDRIKIIPTNTNKFPCNLQYNVSKII